MGGIITPLNEENKLSFLEFQLSSVVGFRAAAVRLHSLPDSLNHSEKKLTFPLSIPLQSVLSRPL